MHRVRESAHAVGWVHGAHRGRYSCTDTDAGERVVCVHGAVTQGSKSVQKRPAAACFFPHQYYSRLCRGVPNISDVGAFFATRHTLSTVRQCVPHFNFKQGPQLYSRLVQRHATHVPAAHTTKRAVCTHTHVQCTARVPAVGGSRGQLSLGATRAPCPACDVRVGHPLPLSTTQMRSMSC